MKGSVLWFNEDKGYGFIKPESGSKDIFVHHSGISKNEKSKKLKKDQIVDFEIAENDKGRIAINVTVAEDTQKVGAIK